MILGASGAFGVKYGTTESSFNGIILCLMGIGWYYVYAKMVVLGEHEFEEEPPRIVCDYKLWRFLEFVIGICEGRGDILQGPQNGRR